MRTTILLTFSLLLASSAWVFSAPKDRADDKEKAPATAAVAIRNRTFAPASVTIKPGDSVTWTNADDMDHTVDAADGSFASGNLKKRDTFTQTFKDAGTYDYGCKLHPRMKGKVIVK